MDLNEIAEVPYPQEPQFLPVEEVVRTSQAGVQKINTPDGTVTVLRFITPWKIYSFQLDEAGAEAVSNALRPSGLVVARPGDLPPGMGNGQ